MISLKINLKSIVLIVSIAFLILVQIVFVSHNSQQPDIFGKYSSQLFSIICINFGFIVLLATAIFNERIAKKLFSYMKNITLSFSTIIVVFIIAEIFVSILNPLGINYFSELKKYFSDMISGEFIFYRHKPDFTRTYQQEYVTINSFGLRDSEIYKDKKTAIRLLLLGDSVTFGWGVNQKEIFPEVLERLLNQNSTTEIEVINAGVGGYNTYQETQYFLNEGIYFNPDMLVLVFVENDFEVQNTIDEKYKSKKISLRGWIFNVITRLEWMLKDTMIAHLFTFQWKYSWFPENNKEMVGIERSGLVERCLNEIAIVCEEIKIPFIIFLFQYCPNHYQKIMNIVKNIGLKERFLVYNTYEFFESQKIDDVKNSIVDSHLNSFGHRLLADGIYYKISEFISKNNYQLNNQDLQRRSIELREFRDNFVHR